MQPIGAFTIICFKPFTAQYSWSHACQMDPFYCTAQAMHRLHAKPVSLSYVLSDLLSVIMAQKKNARNLYRKALPPSQSLFMGRTPLHQGAALQPTDHQTGPGTPFFVNLQALSFTGRPYISDVFGFLSLISWYKMIYNIIHYNSLNFILPASWILWASSWLDVIKSHLTFAHSKTARRIQYRYLQSWVLTLGPLGMLEGPGVRVMKMKPSYAKMFQIIPNPFLPPAYSVHNPMEWDNSRILWIRWIRNSFQVTRPCKTSKCFQGAVQCVHRLGFIATKITK